ncbi:DUF5802 family protein [Natronolimnohabitans sp. A-GB9]|uniref:DUF5802 family protein n=1 Tax=Natronolimnohabitans sp. A-GB9 TaxID=3069757 RepID=UPI0027B7A928|nr:DUF5802 family protein [Natronolimnohabitans sp. A-GB9]MDQ2050104.1 DUF5802 family protein [Natronolimnohabitans sp. A-GB9]
MFEVFSRSYYLGRLYVTPIDGDRAFMHNDQHERINEEVYATGEGLERLDAPLVMKLESHHFPVHGDEGVPANTLAVPEEMLEDTDVRNPPSLREVLLARRERAQQLLSFSGGWSETDGDDGLPNVGT